MKPVAAADFALGRSFSSFVRLRRPEVARAMRPPAVVMVDVKAQHALEMAAVEDQEPVEAFGANGAVGHRRARSRRDRTSDPQSDRLEVGRLAASRDGSAPVRPYRPTWFREFRR